MQKTGPGRRRAGRDTDPEGNRGPEESPLQPASTRDKGKWEKKKMPDENTNYNLGRVGLVVRGAYDSSAAYQKLDVVQYSGSSYVAKEDSTNVIPADVGCWSLLAQGQADMLRGSWQNLMDTLRVQMGRVWIYKGTSYYLNLFRFPQAYASEPYVGLVDNTGYRAATNVRQLYLDPTWIQDADGNYLGARINYISTSAAEANGQAKWIALGEKKRESYTWDYQTPYCLTEEILNAQGVYIEASSEYNANYQAWMVANGRLNDLAGALWAMANEDSTPRLDVTMPHALKNIVVLMGNAERAYNATYPEPISGTFYGSNDGTNWVQIGTFANRATATLTLSEHPLGNPIPYSRVRIAIDKLSSATRMMLTDLRIRGTIADNA